MGEQGSKPPVPPPGDPAEEAPEGDAQVEAGREPSPTPAEVADASATEDDSAAGKIDAESGSSAPVDPAVLGPAEPKTDGDLEEHLDEANTDEANTDEANTDEADADDAEGDTDDVTAEDEIGAAGEFEDEDTDDEDAAYDDAEYDDAEYDDAEYDDADRYDEELADDEGDEDLEEYDEYEDYEDEDYEDEDYDDEDTDDLEDGIAARQLWRDRGTRIMSRALATATFAAAGFLAVTSSVNAAGTDLRAERQTDVADLARAQVQHNRALDADLSKLRRDVDKLLKRQLGDGNAAAAQKQSKELAPIAGLTALTGPGVRVTLDDAPASSRSADIDPDALVVHQQDLQGVVNALWAGGAEALTLQGQRIISTSAIRCVGNTVRVNGLPYSPPYQIEAIGDVNGMVKSLSESPAVQTYLSYVKAPYGLGWDLHQSPKIKVPAFDGSLNLEYAEDRGTASSSGSGNN